MKVLFSLAILVLIATVVLCAPTGQNPPPPMPLQPPPQMMDKRQNYQQQQMPYGNNGYYRDNSREDWSPEDAYKYQMRYNNPNGYNQVNPYNTQQYNPSNGMNGMGMGYNSGYRSGSNQYPYNSQSQGYYQG